MPIAKIQLPDGRIAKFEVPEGTTPDQVMAFVGQNRTKFDNSIGSGVQVAKPGDMGGGMNVGGWLPPPTMEPTPTQQQAAETSPLRAAAVTFGRGLRTVGAGLDLVPTETSFEKQAMEDLTAQNPASSMVGQLAGETAPFVPMYMVSGPAGKFSGPALRVLTGASEGAAIAKGSGGDPIAGGVIGAGMAGLGEAGTALVSHYGENLVRKVTGKAPKGVLVTPEGNPSPELSSALELQGIKFEDLADHAKKVLQTQPGASPEQAARMARANSFDKPVPLTKGELSQDFSQLRTEQGLMGGVESESEPFRQTKLVQSEAVKSNLENMAGVNGVNLGQMAESTGETVKKAISIHRDTLRTQRNAAYKEVAAMAQDKGGIPIFTDGLADALPKPDELRRMIRSSDSKAIPAMQDLLTEFGVIQGELPKDVTVKPLSLANVEEFRSELGRLMQTDPTGTAKVAGMPVMEALDSELDNMFAVLGKDESMPTELLDTLKKARKLHRTIKTELSSNQLAGQLIKLKPDNFSQVVEASKVYDKMVSPSMPVESIRATANMLRASGEEGKKGLASLRSTIILDVMDAAFSSKSKTVQGVQIFNPVAFRNRLDAIGKDKLAAIFKGDEATLGKLMNLDKVAQDLIPPDRAVPKGSADFVTPLLRRMVGVGGNPVGPIIMEAVSGQVGKAKTALATRRAIAGVPDKVVQDNTSFTISRKFPNLAQAMGIAAATDEGSAE